MYITHKILFILLYLCSFSFGLNWITYNNTTQNNTWNEIAGSFSYLRRPITPFVAEIVPQSIELDNCNTIPTNLTGKIVLARFGGCSVEKHIQIIKNAGGIGVVYISDGWRECNLRDQKKNKDKDPLPTLCISIVSSSYQSFISNFTENYKANIATYIDFRPGINPYDQLNKGAMIFRIVWMLVLSSVLIVLSSYKLFQFIYHEKRKIYAITIISLTLLCNIFLFLKYFDNYGYFGLIQNFQYHILIAGLKNILYYPTIVLIGMVHTDIVLKVNGQQSKRIYSRITFFCLLVFIEVPLFLSIITFSTYKRTPDAYTALQVVMLVFLGVSILSYFFGSFVLIWKFKHTNQVDNTHLEKKKRKYVHFSLLILLFGIFIIATFITLLFTLNRSLSLYMIKFFVVIYFADNFMAFSCFVIIFLFQVKKYKKDFSPKRFHDESSRRSTSISK